ncbi:MAG TPA: hypothetical protein VNW95_11735 [Mucilaginibacter sp.]|jgi:hypothetical protein|nr:hypothetical protein [Mucilaginibacter sp.]
MATEEYTLYYLMGDLPTTCPICGARTQIISDFLHTLKKLGVNECLNDNCKYVFLEVDEPL